MYPPHSFAEPQSINTTCTVTVDDAAYSGQRAQVTCSGTDCAYRYITTFRQKGSPYGPRVRPCSGCSTFHRGIDFPGMAGTPIKALEPGTVLQVTDSSGGAGFSVVMRDLNGRRHAFFHLQVKSTLTVGQQINAGTVIGKMDSTGNVTGSHLHYQISTPNGDWTDPDVVLKNWPNY